MWTRKELKEQSRVSFKANYWKAVLVALLATVLIGGFGSISLRTTTPATQALQEGTTCQADNWADVVTVGSADSSDAVITNEKTIIDVHGSDGDGSVQIGRSEDGGMVIDVGDSEGSVHLNLDGETLGNIAASSIAAVAMLGLFIAVASLIAAAFAIALYVFILSPLEVGSSRFFLRNLDLRAEVRELAYAYDNCYKETVKTLFLRSLFIALWSLLFIIPGIYKMYEYRMIPYLLAEDPTMTKDRAFAESKRMMDGQKWRAFVLDLSFIGWHILSALTLGILGVFYVVPYQAQTNAALFGRLRYHEPSAEMPVSSASAAYAVEPPIPPFAAAGARQARPDCSATEQVGGSPAAPAAQPNAIVASSGQVKPASREAIGGAAGEGAKDSKGAKEDVPPVA